ncbi:Lysophospholipid acyltransferase, partial [Teratosphaeriaceae sp. CCFEE 6253]
SRRLLRPFFLHPTTGAPLPRKRYYDLATWLITQLTFSFCTTPFILLSIHDSLAVWGRVYFYCPVGVALCSLFLASPGKTWLAKKAKAHMQQPGKAEGAKVGGLGRADSMDSLAHQAGGTLGVPSEPGREFDELVEEIVEEVRLRRGSRGVGVEGGELRRRVEGMLRERGGPVKKEL